MRSRILSAAVLASVLALAVSCATKGPQGERQRPQPEMILVPGGTYSIGNDSGEVNEGPRHAVTTPSFYIDKYEVTNAQYLEFITETGYPAPPRWRPDGTFWPEDADLPVTWVSWHDAEAFAQWRGVRLPTEVEWEIAASCTSAVRYPWGDSLVVDMPAPLNVAGDLDTFKLGPAPVDAFPEGVSCWGAYNMAGNVWEWVADWYLPSAYQSLPESGPASTTADSLFNQRVIRGGSWLDPIESATTTTRRGYEPDFRSDVVGFRCARDAN